MMTDQLPLDASRLWPLAGQQTNLTGQRTEGSAVFPQEFPALPFPLKLLRGGIPLGLEQPKAGLGSHSGFV